MMGKHKEKWYEPYKIVTTFDKGEIKKRIESQIALASSIASGDCLFYGKEIDCRKYRLYISPRKIMPPQDGMFNPNLPRVVLEIIADFDGYNTTIFWIKPRIFWNSIPLVFYTFFCIDRRINVLIYTFFLCLGVFFWGKYWGLYADVWGNYWRNYWASRKRKKNSARPYPL